MEWPNFQVFIVKKKDFNIYTWNHVTIISTELGCTENNLEKGTVNDMTATP